MTQCDAVVQRDFGLFDSSLSLNIESTIDSNLPSSILLLPTCDLFKSSTSVLLCKMSSIFRVHVVPRFYPKAAIYIVAGAFADSQTSSGLRVLSISSHLIVSTVQSEQNISVTWSIFAWNGSEWLDQSSRMAQGDRHNETLEIVPYSFTLWGTYRIELTLSKTMSENSACNISGPEQRVDCSNVTHSMNSTANLDFIAGSAIGNTNLTITPGGGYAFTTVFKIAINEISVASLDGATFTFGFKNTAGDFRWGSGRSSTQFSLDVVLPPGLVQVWVMVHNISGDSRRINVSIEVAEPVQPY